MVLQISRMGPTMRCLFACALFASASCAWTPTSAPERRSTAEAARFSNEELAYVWAPIHVQDVYKRHAEGRADYIAAIDYDGDWDPTNNWDNLYRFPQYAYAYYAVTESDTHWLIYYVFYHPRDWVVSSWFDTTHENDAEGALVVVRKDGSDYGHYEGMITEAHGDLFGYTTFSSPCSATSLRVDAWNISERYRPCSYQEPAGHGMRACGVDEDIDLNGKQDSVIYIPGWRLAEVPPNRIAGSASVPIRYALIPLDGLWQNRNNRGIFTDGGSFRGDCSGMDSFSRDRCARNGANPPWKWGDDFAFDPAKYLNQHRCFSKNPAPYSSNYLQVAFP